MSFYSVSIHGKQYKVNLSGKETTVNGHSIPADVVRLNDDGVYLVRRLGKAMEVCVYTHDDQTYEVWVNGKKMIASLEVKSHKGKNVSMNDGRIAAPMPGVIIQIEVQVGEVVEKDQVLATLESMKMQMQIRAPYAGQVLQISGQAGQRVDKGALLVRLLAANPRVP
jgi:biotin carboxyl carrier protein